MDISLTKDKVVTTINMQRDDCKVIEHRRGDPVALKKGFSKLHRILKMLPASRVDTLADLKRTRESRGKV